MTKNHRVSRLMVIKKKKEKETMSAGRVINVFELQLCTRFPVCKCVLRQAELWNGEPEAWPDHLSWYSPAIMVCRQLVDFWMTPRKALRGGIQKPIYNRLVNF